MMNNNRIAEKLDLLADLLEFQGANPFRLRAYRNGARVIRDLSEPVESILKDESRKLTEIDGIGKGVAEKCATLVETGDLPQLVEILEQVPMTVLDMLRIPGLGPKKAAVLFHQSGITDLEQLKSACQAGEIRNLDGFGEKTEKAILNGIALAAAANERILWRKADELANELKGHFDSCKEVMRLEFAGSYRRGKETVGDLDILVDSNNPEAVMNHFASFPLISSIIGRGDTKMSVRLEDAFQIDLRVVPEKSFGAALQYFTGSKDHNVVVRGKARQAGLRINEWGVFNDANEEYLSGKEESDIYQAIGLPWIPPELREARLEFESDEAIPLPSLIEESDMRCDLHMHTTATDGKATLEEMIEAARQRGLKFIAITDHSKRVSMANGLDEHRLLEQWSQIDDWNDRLEGKFTVLKGIECDILEAGGMDLSDEVLEQADWVLGAIHYGQQQPSRKITDRILGAIENPHVDCIAHPTGRLIGSRNPYELEIEEIFSAASKYEKALELNANPARLDLNDVYCARARELGIPIAINTDAHKTRGLADIRYGIRQARRGGLTKKDVLNTRTLKQLQKFCRRT